MHSPIWDHAGARRAAARSVCARLQRKLRGSGKLETRGFAALRPCGTVYLVGWANLPLLLDAESKFYTHLQ